MKAWILQTGEPLHCDQGSPRPMRAMNLANELIGRGHEVTIWSSSFYHQEKRHRSSEFKSFNISHLLTINLVCSPGYSRNIGVGRLYDHAIFARNLKRELGSTHLELPDVAFVGYPPIEAAAVMLRWLKDRNIPSIVDVKDQWPALFLDPLPVILHPIAKLVLFPYFKLGRRSIRDATALTSMTSSYIDWVEKFANQKFNAKLVVPLTAPEDEVPIESLESAGYWWDERGVFVNRKSFRVIFVGSHMSIFDFAPLAEAAELCRLSGLPIEFVICGDGQHSVEIKKIMLHCKNVIFPGWIDRSKIVALAARSQAAIAPYRNISNFTMNLPNKIVDALMLGLPLLSPLSGEVDNLISNYKVGFTYSSSTGSTLYDRLKLLHHNQALQLEMSRNARLIFSSLFSYDTVYRNLGDFVESVSRFSRPTSALEG